MENRLLLKTAREEVIAELLEKLKERGWICNAWFDPDNILHVIIYSRKTMQKPGSLREFWGSYFDNGAENLDFS